MHRVTPARSARGFTLAELALVLLVLAILSAVLLVPLAGREEIRRRHLAEAALAEIRDALIGYAIVHHRLPCPSIEPDPADPGYGLEGSDCELASEGYLPWRSLGVAARDPWGVERLVPGDPWTGHWRYRVDPAFAAAATPIAIDTAPDKNIRLRDTSGNLMVDDKALVAVIYSTGPNRSPDGDNASFESGAGPIYGGGPPTALFDDITGWLSHPLLVARLAAAGALD